MFKELLKQFVQPTETEGKGSTNNPSSSVAKPQQGFVEGLKSFFGSPVDNNKDQQYNGVKKNNSLTNKPNNQLNNKDEEGNVGNNMFTIDSFVDTLGDWEGKEDHKDQIGKFTYGYGVLPATARQFGVSYNNKSDRRENAVQVYSKMYDKIREEQPELDFDQLGPEVATAVFSTYINLGSFNNAETFVGKLKEGDVEGAADSLFLYKNVREQGKLKSSKGLVARRAKEYNLFLRSLGKTEGFVTSVEVEGTRDKPVFVLKDDQGNEVKRVDSKYPLAQGNSLKSVSIEQPTVA